MAVILVSAGAGAGASIVTAYATYRMTARQDHRKWRAELAEKYALLLRTSPGRRKHWPVSSRSEC